MSFRNRKLTDHAAVSIADMMGDAKFDDQRKAAQEAVDAARSALRTAIENIVDCSPARALWMKIDGGMRDAVKAEAHNYRSSFEISWTNRINIICQITDQDNDVTSEERVLLEDLGWWIMDQNAAANDLPMFIDEEVAKAWDCRQVWEDEGSFLNLPEHIALDALVDACYQLNADLSKVTRSLYNELRDRNTKEVIAAWPEAEPFIHKHFSYTDGNVILNPITQPYNMFIDNAMAPQITSQAAE